MRRQRMVAAAAGVAILAWVPGGVGESFEGEEVVVTATRTEKPILEVPASIEVIDQEAIRKAGVATVDELLKSVCGVDIQGSGFPGSAVRLSLRGLTTGYQSERVLVLVDGRRINDPYQGNVEFAQLPADGIERIEIVHGPASALYGSNAMGGVINIVTRKGTETPEGHFRVGGGSYGTWEGSASHGWKIGDFDYYVNGSHVQTDGYTHNSDGTERDWLADNLTGNFGLALDDNAEVRFYGGVYSGEGTDENSDRTTDKNHEMLTYGWNWDPKRDAKMEARAYRNAQRDVYDWKYPGEGIYRQDTLAGDVQQSMWIGDRHRATAGAEVRDESVDITEVTGPVDKSDGLGAWFAQDEYHIAEPFEVTAGVREDYNGDYGEVWSPRVGILWRLGLESEVFSSVNRAYRAPSLSDRYVNVEYNGARFEGNPDLKVERLMSYEAGIRQRFGQSLSTELSVFYEDMKDAFDFVLEPDGVFRNRNADRVTVPGVEIGARYRLSEALSTFANYSYMDGRYDEFASDAEVEGNRLAYLARNKAGAGVDLAAPKGFSQSITARYVDSRYGDAQNTAENKLDEYVVVDWVGRLALSRRVDFTLNVNNLLDADYEDLPGVEQPGVTVIAGLEGAF